MPEPHLKERSKKVPTLVALGQACPRNKIGGKNAIGGTKLEEQKSFLQYIYPRVSAMEERTGLEPILLS